MNLPFCLARARIRITAFIAISMTFCHCSNAENVQYYREINTRGFRDFIMQCRIESNLALTVNCFRVRSDTLGRVVEVVYFKDGKPAFNPVYNYNKLTIEYTDSSDVWRLMDLDSKPSFTQANLACIVYQLDSNGVPREKRFYDPNGKITEDSFGVAVYLLSHDTTNRVISMLSTSSNGDTIIDNNGVYEERLSYDTDGNTIEIGYYSPQGRLSNSNQGVAVTKFEYDEIGNVTQIVFLDENSQLCVNNELDFARSEIEYLDCGYVSTIREFRPDDVANEDSGSLCQSTTLTYDDKGNRTKMVVQTYEGGIVQNQVEYEYSGDGDVTRKTYYLYVNKKSDLFKAEILYRNGKIPDTTFIDKFGNKIK
jgi:YD repeat-containing protein